MKRLLVALILFSSGPAYAVGDKAASGWAVQNVSVSTTSVTAIPTTALTGRYKIIVQNLNPTYDVYIGSSTAITTSTGSYVVAKGSTSIELPIPQGITVYGLGTSNAAVGTLDVRVIEFK